MNTVRPGLFGDDPLITVRLPQLFLANHLASTETYPKQPKDRTHINEN